MTGDRVNELYNGKIMLPATQDACRERIHWMCAHVTGTRVLDLGCSQGIASLLLAREGHEVVGADIDPEAIAFAQACLDELPASCRSLVTFQCIDIGPLPFEDESFDTVLLGEILEHQTRPERILAEAARVLKPHGRLVVTTPFGLHPHPEHVRTFYLSDFVADIESLCPVVDLSVAHKYILCAAEKGANRDESQNKIVASARLLGLSEKAFLEAEQAYWRKAEAVKNSLSKLKKDSAAAETHATQALNNFCHSIEGWLHVIGSSQKKLPFDPALTHAIQEMREMIAHTRAHTEPKQAGLSVDRFLRTYHKLHESYAQNLTREWKAWIDNTDSELVKHKTSVRQLKSRLEQQNEQVGYFRAECERKYEEVRYRLGDTLVNAISHPKEFLMLPVRLLNLFLEGRRRRKARAQFEAIDDDHVRRPARALPVARPATPKPSNKNASGTVPDNILEDGVFRAANGVTLRPIAPPEAPPRSAARAAVIMDKFTTECFRAEFAMTTITPDDWQAVLSSHPPDFLFVESAWKGNDLAWRRFISEARQREGEHLFPLVNWCKQHDIPTVFWNKEDPPNYDHFITAASQCDFIFTTDRDCIPRYRQDAGHDRVWELPFAAQPLIHNPVNTVTDRPGKICFAGTYYNRKHRNRVDDMEILLRPAISRGLHIYDRMFHYNVDDAYQFPNIYQPAIQGGLPYEIMLDAYRNYQVFLNVNSVTQSPTMFSRRVLELLACGTPVISTWSEGIDQILGRDCVALVNTEAEAAEWMDKLLNDTSLRERMAMLGQRKVFSEHTYEKRFETIARNVGLDVTPTAYGVSVVASVSDDSQLQSVIAQYQRQAWEDKELILFASGDARTSIDVTALCDKFDNVRVIQVSDSKTQGERLALALEQSDAARYPYLSIFEPACYYGEFFLTDMMLAFQYAGASVIGKGAHYEWRPDSGKIAINHAERERTYVHSLAHGSYIIDKKIFATLPPERVDWNSRGDFFDRCVALSVRLYAADRFNFVAHADPQRKHTDGNGVSIQGPLREAVDRSSLLVSL